MNYLNFTAILVKINCNFYFLTKKTYHLICLGDLFRFQTPWHSLVGLLRVLWVGFWPYRRLHLLRFYRPVYPLSVARKGQSRQIDGTFYEYRIDIQCIRHLPHTPADAI